MTDAILQTVDFLVSMLTITHLYFIEFQFAHGFLHGWQ